MCTDGILEQINDAKLEELLAQNLSNEAIMGQVLEICEGNTKDNFSAYLIKIASVNNADESTLITATINQQGSEITQATVEKKCTLDKKSKWKKPIYFVLIVIFIILGYLYIDNKYPSESESSKTQEPKSASDTTKSE